jgi:hypothetical protein
MSLLHLSLMLFQDCFKLDAISLMFLASCILPKNIESIVSSKILSRPILVGIFLNRTVYAHSTSVVAYEGKA